jgi:predicted nucleic acid-binding protein
VVRTRFDVGVRIGGLREGIAAPKNDAQLSRCGKIYKFRQGFRRPIGGVGARKGTHSDPRLTRFRLRDLDFAQHQNIGAAETRIRDRHSFTVVRLHRTRMRRAPRHFSSHLAAPALEHGGIVYTNDRDFDRFTTVQVRYPLATA